MPRDSVWLGAVPVIDAVADAPGASVLTVPTEREFGGPAGPATCIAVGDAGGV
jgi:hypothetical protein